MTTSFVPQIFLVLLVISSSTLSINAQSISNQTDNSSSTAPSIRTSLTSVTASSFLLNGKTNKTLTKHAHESFNKNASFLSLMTDSSEDGAKVIAEVVNNELSPAAYTIYLTNCSNDLPVEQMEVEPAVDTSFPHITRLKSTKSQVFPIPPLRVRTFMIDLNFRNLSKKLTKRTSCIVSIYNRYNEPLRSKLIDFSPGDTCICSSNCSCACTKEDTLLICQPVDDDQVVSNWLKNGAFDANGLRNDAASNGSKGLSNGLVDKQNGGLRGRSDGVNESEDWSFGDSVQRFEDEHMEYLNLMLLILIILLLLIFGACKGLWGICFYPIGRCCLNRFYDKPRILNRYYESKYANYSVIHDSNGYPLDPFKRTRTVKRLNPVVAFFLNLIFFLCFPFFCLVWLRHCFDEDKYGGFGSDDDADESSRRRSLVDNRMRKKSLEETRDSTVYRRPTSGGNPDQQPYSRELSSEEDAPNLYAEEDTDVEEDEDSNTIGAFHHSQPNPEQEYVAAHAQVYNDQDFTPISTTPLPNSSTLLENLMRAPNNECPNPPRDGPIQVCCGAASFGNWHRTPAIFGPMYDGDSRFDLHKTTELTRRRNTELNRSGHLLD